MKEESLLGPQASTKSSKEWVTFWETLSLENKLKSLILLHCETIFGAKKQMILFGDFQINDRILFNFISNQRKTEPFLLCFILWSVQNGKNRSQMPISQLLYPTAASAFAFFSFFLYRKLTTFLLFRCCLECRDSRSRIIGPQAFSALPRNLSLCPSLMVA